MIRDKIKEDSIVALKNHDSRRVGALRFLISLIDKKELTLPPGTLKDADVVGVLRKELKNKEESREMFVKAGRKDLVDELDLEIQIVKEYLPAEIGEEKLEQIIDEVIKEKGENFGMVMGEVMKRTEGKAGGEVVARIVREKISNV